MSKEPNGRPSLAEAIDRYGPEFSKWPDAVLADEARAAILADRAFRARYDDAVALDRGLAVARTAIDAEIAATGATDRIRAGLRGIAGKRIVRRVPWAAIAAVALVAAGLGGAFDLAVLAPGSRSTYEVVTLDPLGFGMADGEIQ